MYPDRLLRAGDALVLRGGEPLPAGDDLPLRAGEPVSAAGLLPAGGGDAPLPLAGGEPPWRGRDGSLRRA